MGKIKKKTRRGGKAKGRHPKHNQDDKIVRKNKKERFGSHQVLQM
jgi:hypothetical protein